METTGRDSWSSRWRSGRFSGMIVLLTDNLWFAASLHAWINWRAAPAPRRSWPTVRRKAGLPPGASVSLALIAAFIAAFVLQRRALSRGSSYDRTAVSTSS